MHRYFIIYKPVNMVSQFVSPDKVNLLGDLDFDFPKGTHAIGRLDNHSEGLLLLTTNKKVHRLLYLTTGPHQRTYLLLVRNEISDERIEQLKKGVSIRIKGGEHYTTAPCNVKRVIRPEKLISNGMADEEHIPHSWIEISLTEGKYHQVRKMLASVKHPVRRLIRTSIEGITLDNMQPGEVRELTEELFFSKLNIPYPTSGAETLSGIH